MTVTIPLTWTRPPLSGNDRGHTRYNGFSQAKGAARFMVRAANVTPVVGADVGLHWRVTDRRRRDPDNLAATLKACLDALVHEGVLPDDSWVHVPRVECRIHPPTGEPAAMWLELTNIHPYDGASA